LSSGRILIVDDEPQIRRIMRTTLTSAGYEVDDARTGEQALEKVRDFRPDLVLLDMNMPGMGGLAACTAIRRDLANIAIIMLTVRNSEADKVRALDAGADDFVTKPFSTPELLARIRAALRRVPAGPSPAKLRIGDRLIDFDARAVIGPGGAVHLTPKELDLLRFLTQRPNQAVTHRELLQTVWGPDYGDQVEYLRVFIKNLRKKIEPNPDRPEYILTEPWVGYRFTVAADS
jgi:two-component system, OmpR family, KDP operon response regulator KdpE